MSRKLEAAVWESSELKGTPLLVALSLADQANDEGECWPSITTIARRVRSDPSTVTRALKGLQAHGYLTITPRVAAGGRQTSNLYQLKAEKFKPAVKAELLREGGKLPGGEGGNLPGGRGANCHPQGGANCHPLNQSEESSQKEAPQPPGEEDSRGVVIHLGSQAKEEDHRRKVTSWEKKQRELFQAWWELYPSDANEPAAWAKFKKVVTSVEVYLALVDGTVRWIESQQWQDDGGKYIPAGASFLYGQRWKEYPEPAEELFQDDEDPYQVAVGGL